MIKLVTILKRSPSLTRAAFEQRWLDVHAPIAARFPGLRGYMLSFSIEPGDPAAEGVAQLWFDDRLAAQASYASEIGRNGSADANAYLSRRDHLLASETWLRNSVRLSARPFKLILGVKRAGVPREAFVAWWQALDGASVVAATGADQIRISTDEAGQMLNSATAGTLELRDGEAIFDGLLEVWFTDAEAARRGAEMFRESKLRREITAATARNEEFLLRENVVVLPPDPAYGASEEQQNM